MKRKADKIIEVVPMNRKQAEDVLQHKIDNPLYGDEGYLANDKAWLPKSIVESQSKPYETAADRAKYLRDEIASFLAYIKENDKYYFPTIITEIKQLLKEIEDVKLRKQKKQTSELD